MQRRKIKIFMYTKGMGSGHLTRVNAVYKGFVRSGIPFTFYASAHRSKYKQFLDPGIKLYPLKKFPSDLDIFICDWRADEYVETLPRKLAKAWIGLRRLGKIKSTFPKYYHVIAIEPDVKGDAIIWPIIITWPDELLSRAEVCKLFKIPASSKIGLMCENGVYPKHLNKVFNQELPADVHIIKSSNSPYADKNMTVSFYPVSRLFRAVDYLVIGGGYNSLHEALSYADIEQTNIINVGGDDQSDRIRKSKKWEQGRGSRADELAKYIYNYFINKYSKRD